jgi:hypothetical protein
MSHRESRDDEDERMRKAVAVYNGIAESLRLAAKLLPRWMPVRAAVAEVCGIDWDRLSHGTRTLIGSTVRDWFSEDWPQFELTPVRLLTKSNGGGSHMIAIYPLDWLIGKRDAIAALAGEAPRSGMLPFEDE